MVATGDDLPHRSALSIACPSRLLADILHCRSSLRGFSFKAVENLPGPLNHRCLDSSRTSCWGFSHCLRHLPLLGVPNSIAPSSTFFLSASVALLSLCRAICRVRSVCRVPFENRGSCLHSSRPGCGQLSLSANSDPSASKFAQPKPSLNRSPPTSSIFCSAFASPLRCALASPTTAPSFIYYLLSFTRPSLCPVPWKASISNPSSTKASRWPPTSPPPPPTAPPIRREERAPT